MKVKKLVDLSQPFGFGVPLWPYFPDIKIERFHYHAKSGVLTQWLTTPMHVSTHADSPIHVIPNEWSTEQIPLDYYFGTGVVVDVGPKGKWESITDEDLEKATPKIEKGDIVIIHTHMHAKFGDDKDYFARSPGLVPSAAHWLVDKGVKAVGVDQQALDHPLATAIGYHGPGPLLPEIVAEYEADTGRSAKEDFPDWEPCHNILLGNHVMGFENVGGDIDEVLGQRVIIAGFPIRWVKGDGSMVRLVAIIEE
ncbi:MAG TPA: cyclase family protein [Thermoleophilia bacterium]